MRRGLSLFLLTVLLISLISGSVLARDSFVHFREFTQTGKVIDLDEDEPWIDVDINSSIKIDFEPSNLISSEVDIHSTEKMDQLREEIKSLNELLKTGREDLGQYITQINSMKKELIKEHNPELEARYREMLRKHGSFINEILSILMKVIDHDKLNQALSKSDPLYRDLLSLLAEHIENKQNQLEGQIQRAIQENKLTLKVWCIHYSEGKEASAVHLPNYDNLKSGQFNMVEKVTMAVSDDKLQDIKGDIQLYRELKDHIGDIGKQKGDMKEMLADLKQRLASDLKKDIYIPLQDLQSGLVSLAKELKETAEDDETQQLLKTINEVRDKLEKYSHMKDKYEKLLETLSKDEVTPEEIFDIIHATDKLVTSFEKDIIDSNLLERLVSSLKECKEDYTDSLEPKITDLEKLALHLKESIANLDQILAGYSNGFKGVAQRLLFSSAVTKDKNSEKPKDFGLGSENANQVSLADAPSTVLNLTRTHRQKGDHYTLHVQVEGQESVRFQREYTFRVNEFGTSSAWLKNINFVKRANQSIYHPTTSISWVVHYRGRDQGSWIERLNQTLKPGLGLNTIVYSEEGSIKYGMGVTLSLFRDNLQLGGGISLQEEDSQGYFFIGSSLLDILKNIN